MFNRLTRKKADGICRVCGSRLVKRLPVGEYTAFFRLRVDTKKDPYLLYFRSALIGSRHLSRSIPARAARKIRRILFSPRPAPVREFRTYMQACAACHTVHPCHEWSYEDLQGLYKDYRSDTYSRDRISVEPSYARIVNRVGCDTQEVRVRNAGVDAFLRKNASQIADGPMIDYGGSDGRFLPPFVFEHCNPIHIYDASEAPLHPSVDAEKVRKVKQPDPADYSFLACMHVLEHVGNPRAFLEEAAECVRPGGAMYLEIPLELNETMKEDFSGRIIDDPIGIHEHINYYDSHGIPQLVASLDRLELLDQAVDPVDIGWTRAVIGRYLVRKRS